MAGNIASVALWCVAVNFKTFLLSRVVGGLSEGNVQLATAIATDISDESQRGSTMALVGACFSVAFTFGPALGAALSNVTVVAANPFATAAGVSLSLICVETLYLYLCLPETKPAASTTKKLQSSSSLTWYTNRPSLLNLIHFLFLLPFSGVEFSLPFLIATALFPDHPSPSKANGRVLGFIGLIASLLQGSVVRRLPPLTVVKTGVVSCAAAMFMLARIQSTSALYAAAALLAVTSATVVTGLNSLGSFEADEHNRGQVLGALRSWGQLGRALGPVIFCSLFWWAGREAAYTIGGSCMLGVVALSFGLLKSPASSTKATQKVWFDYLNGYDSDLKAAGYQEAAFTITNSLGQAGVHRAHFLDELVKLLPDGVARYGKRLKDVSEDGNGGRLQLSFEDGSTAEADAVIGCDGIKSKVRAIIYGDDHPCSRPTYSHKYAYRGLVPMEKAIEAIGQERAENACMHMGPGGHLLTFPVNHGRTLNIVAFHTSPDPWTDSSKLTRAATREEALRDFAGYGHNVRALLQMTKPNLDCWAIFHLADNPVPHFHKGHIVLTGDAAHATSPHHGAGAGFCIEDSATLATLLADPRVQSSQDLAVVFETFDQARRDRGHWLVQSSQFIGNAYEWLAEGVGNDFKKIESEINRRNGIIANVDVQRMCEDARALLGRNLDAAT
ncbi:hypothetical protein DV737_g2599, partial [Chaetothyriales sp. CBS 132003]